MRQKLRAVWKLLTCSSYILYVGESKRAFVIFECPKDDFLYLNKFTVDQYEEEEAIRWTKEILKS